jgi:hypothetical protein
MHGEGHAIESGIKHSIDNFKIHSVLLYAKIIDMYCSFGISS